MLSVLMSSMITLGRDFKTMLRAEAVSYARPSTSKLGSFFIISERRQRLKGEASTIKTRIFVVIRSSGNLCWPLVKANSEREVTCATIMALTYEIKRFVDNVRGEWRETGFLIHLQWIILGLEEICGFRRTHGW